MPNPYNLKVGQKLYFRSFYSSILSREVTIEKIGRKYAKIEGWRDDFRLNMETMNLELINYGNKGRCYFSKDDYDQEQALSKTWSELKDQMRDMRQPADITLEKIQHLREVLGLIKSE